MRAAREFGGVLARVREEQGYGSAHAFYKSVRGRRALGLSYVSYLNLEQGKSLPQPGRLKLLLAALGLAEESSQAKELVRSYLTSLLGSDDLLRIVAAPRANPGEMPSWKLAEEAARQSLRQRLVRLTLEQYALLNKNAPAMFCYYALLGTPGWVDYEELARMTGLRRPAMLGALKALHAAGLIELSAGKARSPNTFKFVALPSSVSAAAKTFDSLRRYGLLKQKGKLVHTEGVIVRMSHEQMERYRPHLSEAVRLADIYGNAKKAGDTDIFFIEGGVYRIFD